MCVASVGNAPLGFGNFPREFPHVLVVSAIAKNGKLSPLSAYGRWVDVCAPGGEHVAGEANNQDILSLWNEPAFQNKPYRYLGGTSMAAAFVSGVAALLRGFSPQLTNDDIEWIIKISAVDKETPGWDPKYGYGLVNAKRALEHVMLPYKVEHLSWSGGADYGSTDWYTMDFPLRDMEAEQVAWQVRRHEVRATITLPEDDYVEKWIWGRKETIGWTRADTGYFIPDGHPTQWEEGGCEPVSIQGNTVTLRTYVYEVRRVNKYGTPYGDIEWWPARPENVVFEYTLLARKPLYAPSNVSTSAQENLVTIYWQDNSDNEEGFLIYRSEDGEHYNVIDTVLTHGNGVGLRNYTDTTAEIAHTYWYKIRGFAGEYYSEYSNAVRVELTTLLSPEILSDSMDLDNNTVFITFRDNSTYNTKYIIRRYDITRNFWETYELKDTVGVRGATRTFEDTAINFPHSI